jgi:hypothetical protein
MIFRQLLLQLGRGTRASWYSSCLRIGMAFLADSGMPCPPPSTRRILPFDRIEWLIAVPFAVILATIVLLQGPIVGRERPDSPGRAVCEQQSFLTRSYFFLTLH